MSQQPGSRRGPDAVGVFISAWPPAGAPAVFSLPVCLSLALHVFGLALLPVADRHAAVEEPPRILHLVITPSGSGPGGGGDGREEGAGGSGGGHGGSLPGPVAGASSGPPAQPPAAPTARAVEAEPPAATVPPPPPPVMVAKPEPERPVVLAPPPPPSPAPVLAKRVEPEQTVTPVTPPPPAPPVPVLEPPARAVVTKPAPRPRPKKPRRREREEREEREKPPVREKAPAPVSAPVARTPAGGNSVAGVRRGSTSRGAGDGLGSGTGGAGGRGVGGAGEGPGAGKGSGPGAGSGSGSGGGSGGGSGPGIVGFQKPDYPAAARSRGVTGRVVVRYRVSTAGDLLEASVVSSSGDPSLDEAAVAGVRQARFRPAKRNGEPVEGTGKVAVVFRLDD